MSTTFQKMISFLLCLFFYSTVSPKNYAFGFAYVVEISEFQKSEATCNHKTFDFTYWGTFSAQNSEVFVQTDFFLFLADPWLFQKSAFKKFSNVISRPVGKKQQLKQNFLNLPWPIILFPVQKKFLQKTSKIFEIFH